MGQGACLIMEWFERARERDEGWMRRALQLAEQARDVGEVPVGAVIVDAGECEVAVGYNSPIGAHDATAHAEIVALRAAGGRLSNYRLPGLTLYVTLEPCVMCAGAILHARLARVVYGATDPKAGAAGSVYDVLVNSRLNHHVECQGGVLAAECGDVLQRFFRERRRPRDETNPSPRRGEG